MVRAFASHLRAVCGVESDCDPGGVGAQALANVLEGLWQYYSQVCCVAPWVQAAKYIVEIFSSQDGDN